MTKTKLPAVTVRPALDISAKLKYEIVSDKKIKLTRARAFEFLELDKFQGERDVNERHVQFLYNQWSSGRFMWEHVLIGVCLCNDRYYRINGQHTCWLRVNIPEEHWAKLGIVPEVREVTYKVKDEENLRGLYATFDQNKSRTPAHMMKALLIGTVTASDLWAGTISKLGSAMRLWLYEDKHERALLSANDIVALAEDKYSALFKMVGLFTQIHYNDCSWCMRAAVLAAQFATFDVNPDKSPDFWNPVFNGLNLEDKKDPRYQLRLFLETHRSSLESEHKLASSEDTFRVCINAWNKWRGNELCGQSLRPTEKRVKVKK